MVDDLVAFVRAELTARADPDKAGPMAAYLKTDMPFYGVPTPLRAEISKELRRRFPITSRRQYREAVLALWGEPHREEKYFAIGIALGHPQYLTIGTVPLLRRLIVEGAWWDLVDGPAISGIGHILLHDRRRMTPIIDRWIDDPDLWLRRTALICHNGHRENTDAARLFDYCLRRADETEFFIRKAIGWALREYAHTAPNEVREFLLTNRDRLSGLSFREAAKHLDLV